MAFIIGALLWVIPSFFLHCLIHEGAHAHAGSTIGLNFKLYPYPQKELGRWTWAAVRFDKPVHPRHAPVVFIAPVLWETAWFILATIFLIMMVEASYPLWGQGILAVEMVSALVDLTVWMLGFLTMKPGTDAQRLVASGFFSREVGLVGLGVMVPAWITTLLIIWSIWSKGSST